MNHDVAIVGGGLVGATLATALAANGLRVALVEARPPAPEHGDDIDLRVSALSLASLRMLSRLGVWPLLRAERIGVFREMHVWEETGHGEIHFDAAEIGEPALGYVVENGNLQQALEQRLRHFDTLRWYRPARLESLQLDDDSVTLRLDTGRVQARVLVGADGSRSRVRELAGIGVDESAYGQHAVVAAVDVPDGHRETAWQRFLPDGPLAVLPLAGNTCSVVWSTTPEHAQRLEAMTDDDFGMALEEAYESRLGRVLPHGPRAAFPLRSLHAERYVDRRLVLAGDAAHTIHPLAGQGVNLGLLDAAALAAVLGTGNGDPGRRALLRRYERWRRGHNALVRTAMTGFKELFGSDLRGVRRLRNLGLGAAARVAPLRRLFMLQASGGSGDLPPLARTGADTAP